MSNIAEASIKISVDASKAQSNLEKFAAEFDRRLRDLGKSDEEITAFKQIAQDVEAGRVQVSALNQETQELLDIWKHGTANAADRDILGLKAHIEIKEEIEATRAAYERLAESGKLTEKELKQAAMRTEERIQSLRAQTNGWAESLMKAHTALATAGGATAALVKVTGEAIKFESAMTDVAKVVDGSEQQMAELEDKIKKLSRTIPLAADELAKIAAAGGQLGVPVEKLEEFVDLAAKMSTAFGITAEEAGQAVAKLSNVFSLPIEQVKDLGNAINVLGNTTAATEANIVEVLTRIGGTAKQFGLTAEQAAALGSTMLSLGVSSQVAGTGINALLTKLQTATIQGKDFQAALSQMGVSAQQLADDIAANPQKALTEFLHALGKLDGAARAETLSRLFGVEYQDDIARLLGGLEQYEESLGRISDKGAIANAMQNEFNARVKSTEAQLQLLKNAVNEIAINLGDAFLPLVRGMASFAGTVANIAATIVDTIPGISAALVALGSVAMASAALKTVWLSMKMIGVSSFEEVARAAKFARTPILELTAANNALGKAIKGVQLAVKSLFPVLAAWDTGKQIGTALRENFLAVEIAGQGMAKTLAVSFAYIKAGWESVKAAFTEDTLDDVGKRLDAELAEIRIAFADMYNEAATRADRAANAIKKTGDAAKQSGSQIQEGAQTGVQAVERLKRALEKTGDSTKNASDEIKKALESIDIRTPEGIMAIKNALSGLGEQASAAKEEIAAVLADTMDSHQLAAAANTADELFKQWELDAEQLAQINDVVLSASFQKLGMSADEALGRVSAAAEEGMQSFGLLAQRISGSADSPEAKMRALALAGEKLIASFKTTAELDAFGKQLEAMAKNQQIGAEAAEHLRAAMAKQRAEIEQSIPGLQSVGEAMAQAGIKSRKELEQLANEARERFEVIKKSGEATASGLRKAFEDWANAQAAAGMDMRAVEAQAAMLGLQVTVSETGQVTVQAMTQAADAVDKVGDAAHAASDAMDNMADAAKSAADAVDKADSGTRSGGLITWQNIARATGMAAADIQSYNAELQKAWDATRHLVTSKNIYFNAQGISQKITEELRRAVHEAKALDGMIRSMESGHASLKDIEQAAGVVASRVGEVGNERLDRLRTALAEVQGKMRALSDSARDALSNVRDELDQLRGNTEAVEKRRGEAQLAALKAQLKEAQEANNREAAADLARAIKLQEQLNREKLKQVRESKADEEKRIREEAKRAKEQAAEKDRLAAENAARERARNEAEHQRELERIREQDAAKRREERQITQNTLLIEALNKIGHAQGASATANPITINFNAEGILDLSKGNVDQLARALVPRLNNLNRLGFKG